MFEVGLCFCFKLLRDMSQLIKTIRVRERRERIERSQQKNAIFPIKMCLFYIFTSHARTRSDRLIFVVWKTRVSCMFFVCSLDAKYSVGDALSFGHSPRTKRSEEFRQRTKRLDSLHVYKRNRFFSIRTNQCGHVDVFNQWHPAPHYAYLQFSPAARRYEIAMQML